jgi:3-oxoacyl-[acyl-carrier-protein] synthase II
MASFRRVVVTGIGVMTPLGLGVASFWEGLRQGRSGVGLVRSIDTSALPVHIGAEIRGFDARDYLEKKDRKRLGIMVRTFQFAVAAAQLAMEDGRVEKTAIDPTRFGVVMGSATIPGDLRDLGPGSKLACQSEGDIPNLGVWGEKGIPLVPPLWMLTHIPNMMACHVSILHNAQGPNNTITQSDAAGLLALGEACQYIRRNRADMVLVGASDCNIAAANYLRHSLFDQLSRRNEAPEKASRPFDRDRDGWVLGEGGGVLLVESLDGAQRRGARIYAEIVGFAAGCDPGCLGKGLARTMRQALTRAEVAPGAIDHVNAQGNSTTRGDAWEARAIAEVFGTGPLSRPVFAAKGALGHMGAAANTVELAASLLSQQHALVPRTLNYDNPAPDCPVWVSATNRPVEQPHFLKIGFTEMGQCAAVVCRKWS